MANPPRTEFVHRGDAEIAYQVVGDGPAVLQIMGTATHCEQKWLFPIWTRNIERMAQVARLVLYDMRGVGMSDRLPDVNYSLAEMTADALAVLDATGTATAAVWAFGGAGPVAVSLAVNHPDRVRAVLLDNTACCIRADGGYPLGVPDAVLATMREGIESFWGTGAGLGIWTPSLMNDEHLREEWARLEMVTASPRAVGTFTGVLQAADVHDRLAEVTQPTLVVHSTRSALLPVEHGRYLAEHIPGARYIEFELDTVEKWNDDEFFADVVEFLTGIRPAHAPQRKLRVVLFVDIAGSTDQAASIGDRAWADLLRAFRNRVQDVLARYGAEQVNTRGDDVLITAESPSAALDTAKALRAEAARLGVSVRSGAHLGEVEILDGDVAGLAVHIGARIADLAAADEILVSQAVRDATLGSSIMFTSRGISHLKGVPGEWETFLVEA